MAKTKLSDATNKNIQNIVMNYLGTILPNEEVDIEFEHLDDGKENKLIIKCTRQSKTPAMYKHAKVKDGKFKLDVGSNGSESDENADNGKTQS